MRIKALSIGCQACGGFRFAAHLDRIERSPSRFKHNLDEWTGLERPAIVEEGPPSFYLYTELYTSSMRASAAPQCRCTVGRDSPVFAARADFVSFCPSAPATRMASTSRSTLRPLRRLAA